MIAIRVIAITQVNNVLFLLTERAKLQQYRALCELLCVFVCVCVCVCVCTCLSVCLVI